MQKITILRRDYLERTGYHKNPLKMCSQFKVYKKSVSDKQLAKINEFYRTRTYEIVLQTTSEKKAKKYFKSFRKGTMAYGALKEALCDCGLKELVEE